MPVMPLMQIYDYGFRTNSRETSIGSGGGGGATSHSEIYNPQSSTFNPPAPSTNTWSYGWPALINGGSSIGVIFGTGELNPDTAQYSGRTQIDVGVGLITINPGGDNQINFDRNNVGVGLNVKVRF